MVEVGRTLAQLPKKVPTTLGQLESQQASPQVLQIKVYGQIRVVK